MKTIVSKPINGISINGDEYLLNDDGSTMEFNSKEEAIQFLIGNDIPKEVAEEMNFTEVEEEVMPKFSNNRKERRKNR